MGKATAFKCQRVFIALLCLISVITNIAFADPKICTLNGQWFDENSGVLAYKLKQTDSKITMDEEIIHPDCGVFLIEGTANGNDFIFKFFMSKNKKTYCRSWIQFTGGFTATDCAKIKGSMTSHWVVDSRPYESTVPFVWFRNIVKIISPSPAAELIITAEPKMPEFKAIAILERPDALSYLSGMAVINYNTLPFAWNVRVRHSPIPGKLDFDVILEEIFTDDATFTPNFNLLKTVEEGKLVDSGIMGGELTLSVDYYKTVRDERKYIIKGTNPGRLAIEQILADSVARHIACQESRYRQFVADREGGVGFPVIGLNEDKEPVGGAGIMQLLMPKPTAAQAWSWRKNLDEGLKRLHDHHDLAETAHIRERDRINDERKEKGLPLCPDGVPGKLTPDQVMRETIRRYNCGAEYRWEPRDAPKCEGKWIIDPSCMRRKKQGADADYVNKVLSCNIDK